MKKCCGNCKYCVIQKGAYLGQVEYWCDITNGQKRADHICDLHEDNE